MTNANENTDYSQGKMYRIVSPNHDKVYIGSTVETLAQRFSVHKQKRNCTAVQIIDAGDARIEEIEAFPCLDKYQLEDREAELQLADWDGCVNKNVAGAVRRAGGMPAYQKGYYEAHLDQIKAKEKVYREANAEKIKANHKVYREANAEKIKAYHKVYREAHLDQIKAKDKVYYEANKEKLRAQHSKKCTCSCGATYRHSDKARHLRTKRHQKYEAAAKS